jgi:hypothetical protein
LNCVLDTIDEKPLPELLLEELLLEELLLDELLVELPPPSQVPNPDQASCQYVPVPGA